MDEPSTQRLVEGARSFGVELDARQVAAFGQYHDLLLTWNRRINLTRITTAKEIIDRHFLDSLAVSSLVPPASSLLDIGSGAGFPGAVLAVVRPDVEITLCEAIHKKAAFLRALAHALHLRVEVVDVRSEELLRNAPLRRFDIVVSRATLPLPQWVEHGAPFVGAGGRLLAMVSETPETLPRPPRFGPGEVHRYRLPDGTERAIVSWPCT